MVVGQGAGLLDLTALQQFTVLTYDASGNLIETKTGASLLGVSLLPDFTDRSKVSFLATRDFAYVELEVNSAASVLSNTRVYYAFAEDVPLLSVPYPLPVELAAFTGRWASDAAELSWTTASETNSRYFVVERSTGNDDAFRAVGQVAAAGTSTRARAYKFRDAEAKAQGVAALYYRLRQVDLDGKEAFSPLVAITVGKSALATPQLAVYPNPTADAQAVQVSCLNLPAAGGLVQTYSQLGQLVSQLPVAETTTRLALPTLAPGLYYVVLRTVSGQQLAGQKLVIRGN
nr:T9SS type A sorting domain-containing protein [Hymenobacter terricola]